ncbi:hypothetical protein OsJ_30931 [Oryza sativa Japonica Group]|uniref:Uncharacterized protein n=1 Tax=Oryza sativa subsp. japonica TaxID=39947 RepID=B9G7U7_ORYSJ|nr:hypothetical protein OsJ_30931 [Oryza sativa Japonica Group]
MVRTKDEVELGAVLAEDAVERRRWRWVLVEGEVSSTRKISLDVGPGRFQLPSTPYTANWFDHKMLLNFCADLYRFIRRDICNHLGDFYDPCSELLADPKFKNLRE